MRKLGLLVMAIVMGFTLSAQQEGLEITGKVVRYVESDEMVITTSVIAKEKTISEAFSNGNEKSRSVLAYLEDLEDVCEVQTQHIRVQEQFQYLNGERQVVGFVAQQVIVLRLRDFDKYEEIVTELIDKGVEGISNVQFVYSKEDEVREALRLEAIEVAKQKAATVAAALGVEVGPVVHFTEGGYTAPMFTNLEYRSNAVSTDSGPSISPAKSKIEMVVHVRFAILAAQEE